MGMLAFLYAQTRSRDSVEQLMSRLMRHLDLSADQRARLCALRDALVRMGRGLYKSDPYTESELLAIMSTAQIAHTQPAVSQPSPCVPQFPLLVGDGVVTVYGRFYDALDTRQRLRFGSYLKQRAQKGAAYTNRVAAAAQSN